MRATIDYLANKIKSPSVLFFDVEIDRTNIYPKGAYIQNGLLFREHNMYSIDGEKLLKILLPKECLFFPYAVFDNFSMDQFSIIQFY